MTKEDQEHCTAAAAHIQRAIDELDKLSPAAAHEVNMIIEQNAIDTLLRLSTFRAAIAKLLFL